MGTNKANPTALILSATMMLRHLGLGTQANAIAEATYDLVREGKIRTADLGGESFSVLLPPLFSVLLHFSPELSTRLQRSAADDIMVAGASSTTDVTKAIIDRMM